MSVDKKQKSDKNLFLENGLEKIVVALSFGKMKQSNQQFEEKVMPEIIKEIGLIAGQRPIITKARQSIAGFKIRQGEPVGLVATLRGRRMRDFFEKMINVVLPRVRDFRGLPLKNIDQKGSLNIGFRDQIVFPEINPETSKISFGLQVTVVLQKKNREEAIAFYRQKGVPLTDKQKLIA